jgi:hypothetical protein
MRIDADGFTFFRSALSQDPREAQQNDLPF